MIKKSLLVVVSLLVLSNCSVSKESENNLEDTESSQSLDEAAIAAGILPDPDNIKLEGRFEARNDIGTDKFCSIKNNDGSYNIGILAVFGAESICEGQGKARLDGDEVIISLDQTSRQNDNNEPCEFTATYDGISLQIPGILAQSCAKSCNNLASLSGTRYFLVEEGNEAARQSKGRKLKPLCRN